MNRSLTMLLLAALPSLASAQSYPVKPVRLYTQFGIGAGGDLAARVYALALGQRLGQPVVVDSRPGAGGIVVASVVVRTEADGYSLVLLSPAVPSAAILPSRTPLPFDPAKDLAAVGSLWETASILVASTSLPASNIEELIAYARNNPGKLSYGTTGVASSHHLTGEQLNMLAGIQTVHIPYKSSPVADTASGVLPLTYVILMQALPFIRSGKVRPLAITTRQRLSQLPDVPTMQEVVKGFEPAPTWTALFGPGRLPAALARRLHDDTVAALSTPDSREKLRELGFETMFSASPEDFSARLRKDLDLTLRIVKAAKIEAQ